ncbi:MAG: deoxyhypusine synthase family protein [Candidatus Krumholzibacteriota bacterium]|nr:deoxyhypusine synthase family protein [Candidatus Krumholzibacteriota bacterium]
MKKEYLSIPTRPIVPAADMTCSQLLEGLEGCSFQGRQLARAAKVWAEALDEDICVWLGLAGALVPAGMRKVITTLMESGLIDIIVSTGANLYHDYYETAGHCHYIGTPLVDDSTLREAHVDRIYDTYADEDIFMNLDKRIGDWADKNLEERPYTTREFLRLLGEEAFRANPEKEGILSTAARLGIPVYCPAIGDSSIGIGLARQEERILFDVIGDVLETARLAALKPSLVIYAGGGTPKNFIQQTEVTNNVLGLEMSGHQYAIQFVVDAPHWGGLSGCTFEEAVSWGKIAVDAKMVSVLCDATIALPLVSASVLTRRKGKTRPGKKLSELVDW